MTRDIINVQYPVLDHTESIANIEIAVKAVTPANGITIADAFSNKNNSLFIVIDNTGTDSLLTVKAGEAYPNSMLGDIVIELPDNAQIEPETIVDINSCEYGSITHKWRVTIQWVVTIR